MKKLWSNFLVVQLFFFLVGCFFGTVWVGHGSKGTSEYVGFEGVAA